MRIVQEYRYKFLTLWKEISNMTHVCNPRDILNFNFLMIARFFDAS